MERRQRAATCESRPKRTLRGSKAIEFDLPIITGEDVYAMKKVITPAQTPFSSATYQKWDSGLLDHWTSNHNGICMSASNPSGRHEPPADGTASSCFLLQNNNVKANGRGRPGLRTLYVYWPKQGQQLGRSLVSDGTVLV